MISAQQLLSVLKEKDLLPNELLLGLHKRLAQSAQPVTAAEIAQTLIDEGYLTPALANRLLGVDVWQPSQDEDGLELEQEPEQDIGFAPLKEETEPRPMIGKRRPYTAGDSSKITGSGASPPQFAKPVEPSPPKSFLTDNPPPSRWASSAYDRELDSSKGIVSPRLARLAGTEQIPTTLYVHKRNVWLTLLIRGGIGLGLLVLIYVLISFIISQFPR
jgi:hypothetical protein